jgi:hypothetical protein
MWVKVEFVQGDKISGVLDNEPVFAEAELGDEIELELRHVLDIEWRWVTKRPGAIK